LRDVAINPRAPPPLLLRRPPARPAEAVERDDVEDDLFAAFVDFLLAVVAFFDDFFDDFFAALVAFFADVPPGRPPRPRDDARAPVRPRDEPFFELFFPCDLAMRLLSV
jgi:hypothetical protein